MKTKYIKRDNTQNNVQVMHVFVDKVAVVCMERKGNEDMFLSRTEQQRHLMAVLVIGLPVH